MDAEMSRRLVVVRHAKSDWPAGVADHDRPVARRGGRDAGAVGRWLSEHDSRPDLVWCSTARRTRETWERVLAELGSSPEVRFDDRVYAASVDSLLAVLRETPSKTRCVLLLGHNPGVQDLVLTLAERGSDDVRALAAAKFPTSGLAVLDVEGRWDDLAPGRAVLSEFAVPRG
ncbi:MAG: SixA phosphatase family protein [Kineosporiaceae bacterium]